MPVLRLFVGNDFLPLTIKFPFSSISPSFGCSKPAIRRSKVVLPDPLSPTRARISPFSSEKETLSTAYLSAERYFLLMFFKFKIAISFSFKSFFKILEQLVLRFTSLSANYIVQQYNWNYSCQHHYQ